MGPDLVAVYNFSYRHGHLPRSQRCGAIALLYKKGDCLHAAKKALRIITFSKFQEPSSPLFQFFSILKLVDLISLHTLIFMYQYHNQLLPSTFDNFFTPVAQIHSYNTRSAARQTYYLPSIRTNYGKFNVRFLGPQLWNSLEDNIKTFSLQRFKNHLKNEYLSKY